MKHEITKKELRPFLTSRLGVRILSTLKENLKKMSKYSFNLIESINLLISYTASLDSLFLQ